MGIARAQRPSSSLLLSLLIAALPVLATACAAPGAAGQGEPSAWATRRVAIVLTNHGTMWDFPGDASLQAFARSVYERGGVVAAVCHGPAALVNLRLSDGRYLVAGKQVAAFTNEEEAAVKLDTVVPFALESTLRQRGAAFVESPKFEARVAVSDRLVTGQNPASATGTAEAVVVLLSNRAP